MERDAESEVVKLGVTVALREKCDEEAHAEWVTDSEVDGLVVKEAESDGDEL